MYFTITISAQPYKATDRFLLDCGSSTTDQQWVVDERSKFVPSNITTTSFTSTPNNLDPSVPQTPYSTARIINTSSFTYTFPVSQGPKFLRLYFYPATYSGLTANQSFFSVSSNGYNLLTNFSAFLTASFLAKTSSDAGVESPPVPHFVKEFLIYVKDTQFLNVMFTPLPSSYAFINGIEIVSLPDDLYFKDRNLKPVGTTTGPAVNHNTAFENVYRLNMGGSPISGNNDTGMYRSWDQDNMYASYSGLTLTPIYEIPIMYTVDTPNYTAPELVYQTQRSMGKQSDSYNLTWILPVDSGFNYMLRLHFCSIIPEYTQKNELIFTVFVNNQTAEQEVDLFQWTQGRGYPVYKDYVVFVNPPDGRKSKQDLWLALHPSSQTQAYHDSFLNGLEVFKMSMNDNLAGPNPELSFTTPPATPTLPTKGDKKKTLYVAIIGGIGGGLVLLSILVLIVLRQRRRVKHYGTADDRSSYGPAYSESKSTKSYHSTLPSDRCRRFLLTDVKAATNEFSDDCVIGLGGFGKVYKGYIDDVTTAVAIKRLNPSSSQGFYEFHTEIGLLSKLRHVQLVSLIGYCDDEGEMILVYDYMAHGTLREHLYRTSNPPLSWKTRLEICIGAAKGLHYLHTGAKRAIIHRDVKSTNILLDENWVAKVSDFGLSKLGPRDQAQNHVSTVVKGSIGYVDPEYYRTQQLTDKSDVYSFGVVLLEVLCARPAMIPGMPREQVSLAEWGKLCYRKETLNKIVDPKLRGVIAPECLRQFGIVAISCLKEQGSERPAMDEVVWGLEFALELQEAAEKLVGEVVSDNQEHPFLLQEGQTTTDDDMFSGSTAIRNGTSSISDSTEGFKSDTVFSEMQKKTGR
ncbi:receptor-like protein kinase FERONIA [Tanacetum coccineum]|uniref:Receptor-like protein kinase FERONIA n=1 Tax=Tanacetum coccineum TaxID=301880 RepID=A0ABQ5BMB9_9ASTR